MFEIFNCLVEEIAQVFIFFLLRFCKLLEKRDQLSDRLKLEGLFLDKAFDICNSVFKQVLIEIGRGCLLKWRILFRPGFRGTGCRRPWS